MLIVLAVIAFALGYIIPACIEFYERTRSEPGAGEGMVSPFSVRSDWFTVFSTVTVGAAAFLIYEWSDGKIQTLDRDAATAEVLAASVSAFIAFALLKWLEGVIMVLGYMWDNTVGARRRRLAAQEKAEAIEQGRAEGHAERDAEIEILKARIAELERGRNGE
ncbi:MAG: hypothetical protein OXG80_00945 [Chloroflexi bacterium]|nr:hypothetical protein [Chloroflexota bacterium]